MDNLRKSFLVKGNSIVGAIGDKYFSNAPIGVIQAFSGTTIPYGYLLADGASYKVADYPDLYAVIGNTYGGDSTNFNVPNLIDKFIQGSTTSGEEKEAGLPNITGTFYHDTNATSSLSGAFFSYTKGSSQNLKNDDAVKSSGYISFNASKSNAIYGKSTTVQPPALTMVYIIKAFHTNEGVDSGVSDDVINYINDSLMDKADKSYVDDNFATMDKVESKYEEATLDTPVDWNTLNTKARYYVSGGAIMTNAPMQQPFGELVVETAGDGSVCRVQKFFSFDGRLYMRRWTGSVWNEWYKFDGTAN